MQHRQKGRSVVGDDTRQDGLLLLRLDFTLDDFLDQNLLQLSGKVKKYGLRMSKDVDDEGSSTINLFWIVKAS